MGFGIFAFFLDEIDNCEMFDWFAVVSCRDAEAKLSGMLAWRVGRSRSWRLIERLRRWRRGIRSSAISVGFCSGVASTRRDHGGEDWRPGVASEHWCVRNHGGWHQEPGGAEASLLAIFQVWLVNIWWCHSCDGRSDHGGDGGSMLAFRQMAFQSADVLALRWAFF